MVQYIRRIGIATSVMVNVAFFFGESNQTFSARNWAWHRAGKPNIAWLIDLIFFADPNHCANAWSYWYTRKHCIGSYADNEHHDLRQA